ncbi:hypothetical protein GQ600_8112 [Phytophthora cactorum]|nr:hypothetical protein GQ600_8112 [Phytophthora cactorum]
MLTSLLQLVRGIPVTDVQPSLDYRIVSIETEVNEPPPPARDQQGRRPHNTKWYVDNLLSYEQGMSDKLVLFTLAVRICLVDQPTPDVYLQHGQRAQRPRKPRLRGDQVVAVLPLVSFRLCRLVAVPEQGLPSLPIQRRPNTAVEAQVVTSLWEKSFGKSETK